jgi:exodeoxyribonuclease VII small subunit
MKENYMNEKLQRADIQNMSYEDAILLLEQIISTLESGDQPLENALTLYERGKALAERCSNLLDQAELRVKQISGNEIIDFNIEERP